MAWTTPKTWASGYVVLAADLNTHLRDNISLTAPAVMTTQGDIVIASGANTPIRLAKSTTSTQYLANTGTNNAPAWNEVALTTGVSGLLPTASGGLAIALSAPGADRILFWDHSATAYAYLTAGSGLTVSGTTMTVAALLAVVDDTSPQLGGNLDMQARLLVGNGGTTGIAISANGEVTMAAQPASLYYNSVAENNVTGTGTVVTLDFDTEVFDQNDDFASDTFTAPITGLYQASGCVRPDNFTTAATYMYATLITSNATFYYYLEFSQVGGTVMQLFFSTLFDMEADDTAYVSFRVFGESSNVIDIPVGVGDTSFGVIKVA